MISSSSLESSDDACMPGSRKYEGDKLNPKKKGSKWTAY
jgi:hypothetical protein